MVVSDHPGVAGTADRLEYWPENQNRAPPSSAWAATAPSSSAAPSDLRRASEMGQVTGGSPRKRASDCERIDRHLTDPVGCNRPPFAPRCKSWLHLGPWRPGFTSATIEPKHGAAVDWPNLNANNMAIPTVFILDDDAACRDAAMELVHSVGLPAEGFASAQEFLEAFDPARPGCLVLDLRMPRMDGLALQAHLMALGARIPIVFVSGHSDIAMAVRAIRNGAVDFVQKPYPGQQLLDAIDEALKLDASRSTSFSNTPGPADTRIQVSCATCTKVQVGTHHGPWRASPGMKTSLSRLLAIVFALLLAACAAPGSAPGATQIRQGTIEQINPATLQSSHHGGVGAIVGGLGGLGIGSLIGGGTGRDVAMVVGAIGGAVAGNEVQKKYDQPVPGQQFVVRTSSGVLVAITQPATPGLRVGQRI